MEEKYYPLHVHLARGSVSDSLLQVDEYVEKAKEYGVDALAVTDHGSMSAIYDFADECIKNDIKPIIGMEAYEVEDHTIKTFTKDQPDDRSHLILLARNEEGFHNLIRMHNEAQIDGLYGKFPRCDMEMFRRYGKGLIATSACISGRIPKAILANDAKLALKLIQEYKACFDAFYLEIQPTQLEKQYIVNEGIVQLARYTDTPLVVTNDIHYLNKEDAYAHNAHVLLDPKSNSKKNLKEWLENPDRPLRYGCDTFWFMCADDVRANMHYSKNVTPEILDEAMANAKHIAEECNVTFPDKIYMPEFPDAHGDEEQILRAKCYKRLKEISEYKSDPSRYEDELERELAIIHQMGFDGYFLIVWDYVNYARTHGIQVGPGRGSAAGCLVSYLLGIVQADPIQHGLMFERFLDPERAAIPDIDIDFPSSHQEDMFNYVVKRYGHDHVARVGTFGIRKPKAAIQAAGRILELDKIKVPKPGTKRKRMVPLSQAISSYVPEFYYGDDGTKKMDVSIEDAIKQVPELQDYQKQYPDLFKLAIGLEGRPSTHGMHAAGVIISPVPLTDKIPLVRNGKTGDEKNAILATSLDLEGAEKHFVKFDFLILGSLDVMDTVEKATGFHFDYQDESLYRDPAAWNLFRTAMTTGCFQVGSHLVRQREGKFLPQDIDSLAMQEATFRGPCISTKLDQKIIDIRTAIRNGQLPNIEHICPEYDEPTKETYGVPVYQEEVMHIFTNFGFSNAEGYKFIKLAAKKKVDEVAKYETAFMKHAEAMNIPQEKAAYIFGLLKKSAEYSFNKSHAVSYAMVTFMTAYYKAHYPKEFVAALLTNLYVNKSNTAREEELPVTLRECRKMGLQFLPADINKYQYNFTDEEDKIRIGMCAVKGLGAAAAANILENQPFSNIDDMRERVDCGVVKINVFRDIIMSGMADEFIKDAGGTNRYDFYLAYFAQHNTNKRKEPDVEIKIGNSQLNIQDTDLQGLEEAYMGASFIYNPMNDMQSFNWDLMPINQTFQADAYIVKVKKIKTKTNKQMAFLTLGTGDGELDCTVFPSTFDACRDSLKEKKCITFIARKEDEDKCILQSLVA